MWIDIAKAFGIFFIVLGHVCKADYMTDPLRLFCYSFNAQIFFIISGITFLGINALDDESIENQKVLQRIMKWEKRIIVPYLVWGTFSIIVYWAMGRLHLLEGEDTGILSNILGMIYGNSNSDYFQWNRPLWFLPCLFCIYVMWLCTVKLVCRFGRVGKDKTIIYALCCIVVFVCGKILEYNRLHNYMPWHFDTAIYVYPLMGIGIIYKNITSNKVKIDRSPFFRALIGLVLIGSGLLMGAGSVFTDLRQGVFNGYLRFYLVSIVESFGFIMLSKSLFKSRILEYIGERTLPILLMHKFPILFFQRVCPIIRDILEDGNVIVEFGISVIVIGMCIMVSNVFERVCPIVIGMKAKSRSK